MSLLLLSIIVQGGNQLLRLTTMLAGSKIKVTSMLHMAWELLTVMAAYRVFGIWAVRTTVEEFNTAR